MSTKELRLVVVGRSPQPVEAPQTLVLAAEPGAVAPEGARFELPPPGRAADKAWLQSVVSKAINDLAEVWNDGGTPPPLKSARELLAEIQKMASWYGERDARTRGSVEVYESHPDHAPGAADAAIRAGLEDRKALDSLKATIRTQGVESAKTKEQAQRLQRERPQLRKSIEKELANGRSLETRRQEAADARKKGGPLTTIKPSARSHRIQSLPPAAHWRLFIDESGANFGGPATAPGKPGRVVGVLVPDPSPLPVPTTGFHGIETSAAEADEWLQRVLDAPVGVFGIEADGLPNTAGDRWESGVLEVVQWVARLLPKTGPTRLDVIVEQRGIHDSKSSWAVLAAHLSRQLVEVDPARYSDFEISVVVKGKGGDLNLGYADVVAFTWGSPRPESQARLKASGLVGQCLLLGAPNQLRALWDELGHPAQVTGERWREAVSNPSAADGSSLAGLLLRRLGEAAEKDPALWRRLTEAALAHLDSKAVDLKASGREFAWLEAWRPPQEKLPSVLRLAWLTGRLEARNHEGQTTITPEELRELDALSAALFDEAPSLVCQADLNRAVFLTNRFDFDGATRALDRWRDLPPAVPGLRHWGRVQSSLGQHEAFRGHFAAAREHFRRALDAFARLSDPITGALEVGQTRSYDAIAAMDDPSASEATVRDAVSAVVSLDVDAIRALARSNAPRDKYRHHLLLRYLVTRGTPEERAAYLSAREEWQSDLGHPWPLIHAWRAALLADSHPDEALQQVLAACEDALSEEQGPLVQFIGMAISTAAIPFGWPLLEEDAFGRFDWLLPLASDRLNYLRSARSGKDSFVDVLRQVLPFNFR